MADWQFAVIVLLLLWIIRKLPAPSRVDALAREVKDRLAEIALAIPVPRLMMAKFQVEADARRAIREAEREEDELPRSTTGTDQDSGPEPGATPPPC